ncbi:hypothetical protein DAPPUDRAFT_267973 [Daphnia pulex]|uniref:Uncharacterized protein n=1 Tax=Daphnia pulex TaxID=6669 RepID=E9HX54_DAPPU|nr:hypothetical protein DAPPUDRAFT_267973 [Daphnia pulex]|eukprot:EFX63676.1 hypothetical protein DAPPUDRAFT_267973 [Daphnia pulex]
MLADINAYLGEGLATSLKPAGSIWSRSSRAPSRNSAQSKEDKIQEKARKVAETELRLKQAQEEARLREIEEEKIRRLEEDKRKEELKVEAERTQRQLRNELKGHHLESQILIQQLEVEREGARPRGLSVVKKSRQRRVADQPGQIDRRETHHRTNLCTCRRQQSEPPKTVDRRCLALKWRTGPQ